MKQYPISIKRLLCGLVHLVTVAMDAIVKIPVIHPICNNQIEHTFIVNGTPDRKDPRDIYDVKMKGSNSYYMFNYIGD